MSHRPRILITRLDPRATVPSRAYPGDAGYDLRALDAHTLEPGERCSIGTGLALALPAGWVGLVHPRSGLALHNGITLANSPGTIDAGYRGELAVIAINLGQQPWHCRAGDRIAQLLIAPAVSADWEEVDGLPGSTRGGAGFGSSGSAGPIG